MNLWGTRSTRIDNSELDEDEDGKVRLFICIFIRNKNGVSKKPTSYFRLGMPRMLASSEGWVTMTIYQWAVISMKTQVTDLPLDFDDGEDSKRDLLDDDNAAT